MIRASAGAFLGTARGWASLLFFAALVVACGGGDDGPAVPVQHQPSIGSLRYSPTSTLQVPGGTATINGTFDFLDSGGDIASVRITSSGGVDVSTPTPQLAGIAAGTAVGQITVSTDQPGRYTFEVWVTDSMGLSSNRLSGTFEVVAVAPPSVHAPTISALNYSPSFAYQASGGTAPVTVAVLFGDTGGDLVALHVTIGSLDLMVSTFDLAGVTAGTATGTFQIPIGTIGRHNFEVWAGDGNGAVSNRVAGTFEVLDLPVTSHVPVLANLRLSPTVINQASGTVLLSATVDFADAGGDIATFRIASSDGTQGTVTGSYPAGGTTTLTIAVPSDRIGKFTLQVWATDSKGATSAAAFGAYEVLVPDTWTRLPYVPPRFLSSIAWNGSRYVAVGEAIALTSLDLATWTVKSFPSTTGLSSVAGTSAGFVAVGGDNYQALIVTSAEGNNWNEVFRASAPAGSWLSKVIWAGTQYVAVGYENPVNTDVSYALFLTSPDGVTWTQQATRLFQIGNLWGSSLRSVAWSGSVFIATGQDATNRPAVWRSPDAITWTQEGQLPGASPLEDYDVTWGLGRFVAVGPSGVNGNPTFASTDGLTWQIGSAGSHDVWSVAAGPDGFVAIGYAYRQSSTDGLQWTAYPMTGCGGGITWDGARYIAVGESICRSP